MHTNVERWEGKRMTEFIPSAWLFDTVEMDEIERDWLDQPGPYGVSKQEREGLKALMQKWLGYLKGRKMTEFVPSA
jgi:hypothetical protein